MARKAVKAASARKAPQNRLKAVLHSAKATTMTQIPDVEELMAQLTEARETIRDLSGRIGKTARDAHDSASAAFAAASDKVSQATTDASEKATAAAQSAVEGADAIATEIETFTRRNPIVALTAAVGLGLVIGMAARSRK